MPLLAAAAAFMLLVQDTLARAGLQGPLTILLLIAAVFMFPKALMREDRSSPNREPVALMRRMVPWPVWLLPIWATSVLVVSGVTTDGVQNVIVYWLFPLTAAAVSAASSRGTPEIFVKWTTRLALVAAIGYVVLVLATGPGLIEGFHGARGTGWGGLFAMCVIVPFIAYGNVRPWVMYAIMAAIVLSLSRTPAVIGAGLLLIPSLSAGGTRAAIRLGIRLVLVAIAGYVALTRIPAVRDRFVGGDNGSLLGVKVNTSGRDLLWEITLRHFHQAPNPLLGWGPGAISEYLPALTGQDHPHNEYLRLLHDTGYVGVVLWSVGALTLVLLAYKLWRAASDPVDKACHLGALISMLALMSGSLTDNLIISILDVLPAATMVGLSLSRPTLPAQKVGPTLQGRVRRQSRESDDKIAV
ncbi:O-antigen ligase family protein [Nocardioides acrostichi]|uniref:O-antigen ligase family protein n=1 Tax=Nocardioides acrostichi TaxID=2784339 RepID=A0A930V522_9ACTN|nr:O-antigen ligase family protein [Nocardioides acrostichi]MBF4163997.1 O-antigen ligase family protein [Nocardioides acrostichi]